MSKPISVSDIFRQLGGLSVVAKILVKGHSTVSEMRRRGRIPVEYWPALIASDEGKKAGLSADLLLRVHTDADELCPQIGPGVHHEV